MYGDAGARVLRLALIAPLLLAACDAGEDALDGEGTFDELIGADAESEAAGKADRAGAEVGSGYVVCTHDRYAGTSCPTGQIRLYNSRDTVSYQTIDTRQFFITYTACKTVGWDSPFYDGSLNQDTRTCEATLYERLPDVPADFTGPYYILGEATPDDSESPQFPYVTVLPEEGVFKTKAYNGEAAPVYAGPPTDGVIVGRAFLDKSYVLDETTKWGPSVQVDRNGVEWEFVYYELVPVSEE